ncbi:ribonuclease D [Amphiplicatus metriothermophilus]|uniref:Ribonuclease D n=1 Tax=Amphiplicatus metriothermophilus TaxID=1519374 RepID=A0A239PV28_9PROT|nr:ribonuclease D [Amphiplicatus metriothermophilus]MBB5519590.1 ribonuclease D [Amphiplicatus metriothermophilus]SNT74154.1 ribonuclease D [Amphiplicatus metriothermophilus]
MQLITDTKTLAETMRAVARRPYAAIDTEFMREKTYWPILCLVQVAAEGVEAVIDPLASGIELDPLLETLQDERVVKVFHAARQDVEIFHHLTDAAPTPLFDTQIAAMACGFGDQIGYEPLMRALLGARIDKGSRFTDWSRRPLSQAQLAYALSDVTYLRDAYPILEKKLAADDRAHWVAEEMAALADPALYRIAPEEAWKRLKLKGVRPADLGPVIKLAEWREREAQTRDAPRGRILKDEAIFELARLKPKTPAELARARSIPTGFERSRAGQAILDAIAAGAAMDKKALPKIDRAERRAPPPDVLDLLKVLLKRQCERFHVAPKLVASAADLEAIALGEDAPALHGWRREVFGALALRLRRGEIALKLGRAGVDVVPAGDQ